MSIRAAEWIIECDRVGCKRIFEASNDCDRDDRVAIILEAIEKGWVISKETTWCSLACFNFEE